MYILYDGPATTYDNIDLLVEATCERLKDPMRWTDILIVEHETGRQATISRAKETFNTGGTALTRTHTNALYLALQEAKARADGNFILTPVKDNA